MTSQEQPSLRKRANNAIADISGEWGVEFGEDGDTTPALGSFEQNGNIVTGTFLTPTGDYRFLEGKYSNGVLKLSCFDGAHAFLFTAKVDEDGKMIGDFYSRNIHVNVFTAEKGTGNLPDAYELTKLLRDDNKFPFEFPDLSGKLITNRDSEFQDKPLILVIYGSWCPNCNDEAQLLVELYKEYHDKGLEILGLANEFTGDFKKDSDIVSKYVKKYGIEWPQLIVGMANKSKTTESLKHFNKIISYPTTVFIDRQGNVKKIHTGFTGPATGKYYEELKEDFHSIIKSIL